MYNYVKIVYKLDCEILLYLKYSRSYYTFSREPFSGRPYNAENFTQSVKQFIFEQQTLPGI